jgi:hypothetical protein
MIAYEHLIKRGFIYMLETNNNSKSQTMKTRQMEEFQLSSKYLSIMETLY